MDDFGTGYSSLSYLEELPIDNLKIDRKFVQRMIGADNTRTLVQSIVGLAHGMGMRAVAEDVETGEQLEHSKPWDATGRKASCWPDPRRRCRFRRCWRRAPNGLCLGRKSAPGRSWRTL